MNLSSDSEINESITYIKKRLTDALRAKDSISDHRHINRRVSSDIRKARSLLIKCIEDASVSQSELEGIESEEEAKREADEQDYQEQRIQEKAEEIALIIDSLNSEGKGFLEASTNERFLLEEALGYYFERYQLTTDERNFIRKVAETYNTEALQDYV